MERRIAAFLSGCLILCFFSGIFAQNLLNNPESVVYDGARNRYLVSNKGNGQIIAVDKDGTQSLFNGDQESIRGLHILGESLYASCNAGVAGFDLETGTKFVTLEITERQFLNDITSDVDDNLYVSDTGAGKIYKINSTDHTYSIFVDNIASPNGLFYDLDNNRLLVCHWQADSPINEVALSDASVSVVVSTTLSYLDGLTSDYDGNIYVSSWGTDAVYRFDPLFSNAAEEVSSGHNGPADIFFNEAKGILAVPNFNGNTVDFIPMALYCNPESVVYDGVRDRYLVSNKGNGQIIAVDSDGNKSVFNNDQESIRGMHILENSLYVSCNAGVAGFDLETGTKTMTVAIAERQFLNDITSDGSGELYVSDTGAGMIYKVNPQDQSYTIYVNSITSPNGLLHDQANNRLLVCHWQADSPISAVALSDATVSTVVSTTLSYLDGLAVDNERNIYVSSWMTDMVYKFDAAFSTQPEEVSSGHSGPADIYFNKDKNILAVPNFVANTVDFISIPSTAVGESGRNKPAMYELNQNYPNPFNPSTRITYSISQTDYVCLKIFDIKGREIETLVNGLQTVGLYSIQFEADNLPSGIYFYRLQVGNEQSEARAMSLMR